MRPLLILLLGLLLAACDSRQDAVTAEGPKPAIWEIADDAGAVEGWLFGTIHSLEDGVSWRSPLLEGISAQADMLVVEAADLDEDHLRALHARLAYDAPPLTIDQRIDPEHAATLASLREKSGAPASAFDEMETWAAAIALSQIDNPGRSENGVDRALIAEFDGREILEIEGSEAQIRAFDNLPENEQTDLLNLILAEKAKQTDGPDEIGNLWLAGDVDGLLAMTRTGMLSDPELRQALLVQRNLAWAERLGNLLSTAAKPLVAVGAGHMVGDEGLPALLESQGYTIRRIQ